MALKLIRRGSDYNTNEHDKMLHRDLPDQHPISAITGLKEALSKTSTSGPGTTQYIYNNDVIIKAEIRSTEANGENYDIEYSYDSDNKLTSESKYDLSHNLLETKTYTYDNNDNVVNVVISE